LELTRRKAIVWDVRLWLFDVLSRSIRVLSGFVSLYPVFIGFRLVLSGFDVPKGDFVDQTVKLGQFDFGDKGV
jgi:hypothetical protein